MQADTAVCIIYYINSIVCLHFTRSPDTSAAYQPLFKNAFSVVRVSCPLKFDRTTLYRLIRTYITRNILCCYYRRDKYTKIECETACTKEKLLRIRYPIRFPDAIKTGIVINNEMIKTVFFLLLSSSSVLRLVVAFLRATLLQLNSFSSSALPLFVLLYPSWFVYSARAGLLLHRILQYDCIYLSLVSHNAWLTVGWPYQKYKKTCQLLLSHLLSPTMIYFIPFSRQETYK